MSNKEDIVNKAKQPSCGHYDDVVYCPHCDSPLCADETCPKWSTHEVPACGAAS